MPAPLLSTYRTGENRITASTMAVLERIDLALVTELLAAATKSGPELESVTFINQVTGPSSVPDAVISARFEWLFETKTVRGAYNAEGHSRSQLREHAKNLVDRPETRLFVLTPDPVQPAWFSVLDGIDPGVTDRILWLSFADLATQATAVIADPVRPVGEQTRFLLSELIALYEAEGLLTSDDTVIVAARKAWPEYDELSAYVCQPDRTFREGLTHFGFYTDAAIQPTIARILRHEPSVAFTADEVTARRAAGDDAMADVIEKVIAAGKRTAGESHGVFLLSGPSDPETVKLAAHVTNDTTDASGKPWAWTLGQRYTGLDKLRSAAHTSDLA
jgi:hypothetical protein